MLEQLLFPYYFHYFRARLLQKTRQLERDYRVYLSRSKVRIKTDFSIKVKLGEILRQM